MHKVNPPNVLANFTKSIVGSTVVNDHNPTIKIIIKEEEISGCIIEGSSGVNVISRETYNRLGIATWEACPFLLCMVDTQSVQPLGLL
mgnify:CR=1 FL=1